MGVPPGHKTPCNIDQWMLKRNSKGFLQPIKVLVESPGRIQLKRTKATPLHLTGLLAIIYETPVNISCYVLRLAFMAAPLLIDEWYFYNSDSQYRLRVLL